jgi:hypothetical protein
MIKADLVVSGVGSRLFIKAAHVGTCGFTNSDVLILPVKHYIGDNKDKVLTLQGYLTSTEEQDCPHQSLTQTELGTDHTRFSPRPGGYLHF